MLSITHLNLSLTKRNFLDKLDNLLEKVKTKAEEQREKIYNNKLQEIEEAHSKWAEEHLFES